MNNSNAKTKKYNIHERLKQLPMNEYRLIRKQIPEKLGIARTTFNKYLYLDAKSNYDMPGAHLLAFAKYFNCKPEELYNEQPDLLKDHKQ